MTSAEKIELMQMAHKLHCAVIDLRTIATVAVVSGEVYAAGLAARSCTEYTNYLLKHAPEQLSIEVSTATPYKERE